jgi:hypothetical protein
MRTLISLLIAATVCTTRSQAPLPDLDTLVDRLGAYLTAYEAGLSTLIAAEHYRQSESRLRPGNHFTLRTRTLESEIAFLRLPGNAEWFGVRHVLKVDRRQIKSDHSLTEALKSSAPNSAEAIQAIVRESSRHNIGPTRTVNMPTVPLELLHSRHRARFEFRLLEAETIGGTRTHELRYREIDTRGIIRDRESRQMLASGSAWVDEDGRLWRVTMRLEHAHQAVMNARTAFNELRVDFALNPELEMLVPIEMREEFDVEGGGEFKGRATYANYRRYTTSARIIP